MATKGGFDGTFVANCRLVTWEMRNPGPRFTQALDLHKIQDTSLQTCTLSSLQGVILEACRSAGK